MVSDVAVIGAGVATARKFALEGASVLVIERGKDILSGASKANGAILHTAFDAPPAQVVVRDWGDAGQPVSAATLRPGRNIRHVQRIAPGGVPAHGNNQLRLSRAIHGRLVIETDGKPIWSRALDSRPERRILLISVKDVAWPSQAVEIVIHAEEGR